MTLRKCFDEILDSLAAECRRYYRNRLMTLGVFGSVGRNTPNQYSDIDILIVASELPRGRLKRVDEFSKIENSLSPILMQAKNNGCYTELSPVIKTPEEVKQGSLLFLDMIEDLRILYDQDNFFRRQLEKLTNELSRRDAVKIPYKGAWYWDLKPDFVIGED